MKNFFKTAVFVFWLYGLLTPASALLLEGGRGNTSPPADPDWCHTGWNNTGSVRSPINTSRAGVVYLCDDWFITTYHAWWYDHPTGVVVGTTGYTVDTNSMVRLTNNTTLYTNMRPNADLAMFRVKEKPELSPLNITTMNPGGLLAPVLFGGNRQVVMIGNGNPRVDRLSYWKTNGTEWIKSTAGDADYSGYKFWPDRSKCVLRWGTNQIEPIGLKVNFSASISPLFGDIWGLQTTFDKDAGPNECQVGLLDSGGGVFYKNNGYWQLAGLMTTMVQPDGSSPHAVGGVAYGGYSLISDLSYYREQIMRTLCPGGWADLTIKEPPAPVTNHVSAGSSVSVGIETINQEQDGVAASNFCSSLYLIRSWDGIYHLADQQEIPVLNAGESVTNTFTFQAPDLQGTYLMIAKTDDNETVYESYENNNQSGSHMRILEVDAGFRYVVNTTNLPATLRITGYTGSGGSVVIPEAINGSVITEIGTNAFADCSGPTEITVPAGVTNIGDNAFSSCDSLRAIYFEGNAPSSGSNILGNVNGTVLYRRPEASGWPQIPGTWNGVPTELQFTEDWIVYEGKLKNWVVTNKNGVVIGKESANVLTAIYTKESRSNAVMLVWTKTAETSRIVDAVLTTYPENTKTDSSGRYVSAKSIGSLLISRTGWDSLSLGSLRWNRKYSAKATSEKLSISLTGRSLEKALGKEGYEINTLRYNQKLSDSINAAKTKDGIKQILDNYASGLMKRPVSLQLP